MWVELRCCSSAKSHPYAVNEVLRDHSVQRTYIELAWFILRASLKEVLCKHPDGKHNPFEMLCLRHILYEVVDSRLTFSERSHSVLVPEIIVSYLGIGIEFSFSPALEIRCRYFVERIV